MWRRAGPCRLHLCLRGAWGVGAGDSGPPGCPPPRLPPASGGQQVSGSGVLATDQVGTGAWSCLSVPVVTKPSDACAPAGREARAPKGGVTVRTPRRRWVRAGTTKRPRLSAQCPGRAPLLPAFSCCVREPGLICPPFPLVCFCESSPKDVLIGFGGEGRGGERDRQQCERHFAWLPPAPP